MAIRFRFESRFLHSNPFTPSDYEERSPVFSKAGASVSMGGATESVLPQRGQTQIGTARSRGCVRIITVLHRGQWLSNKCFMTRPSFLAIGEYPESDVALTNRGKHAFILKVLTEGQKKIVSCQGKSERICPKRKVNDQLTNQPVNQ